MFTRFFAFFSHVFGGKNVSKSHFLRPKNQENHWRRSGGSFCSPPFGLRADLQGNDFEPRSVALWPDVAFRRDRRLVAAWQYRRSRPGCCAGSETSNRAGAEGALDAQHGARDRGRSQVAGRASSSVQAEAGSRAQRQLECVHSGMLENKHAFVETQAWSESGRVAMHVGVTI